MIITFYIRNTIGLKNTNEKILSSEYSDVAKSKTQVMHTKQNNMYDCQNSQISEKVNA